MTDDDDLMPQSAAWYERLARRQRGYFYDWRATLEPGNGEELYTQLVERELGPSLDVVDAGCGHGKDVLRIATRVRSVVGYDRMQAFIELAEAERRARGIDNARFVCADSKPSGMPLPASSIDLFLCRRGPRNWIADAARVARPGAVLLMLSPISGDVPAWNDELPEQLRFPRSGELPSHLEPTRVDIGSRPARIGAKLTEEWYCEVDELFSEPRELHRCRVWGREPALVPSYEPSAPGLERVFARHATGGHLRIEHRRWICRAVAPAS
jgi:SAM-dependent methyltransferase